MKLKRPTVYILTISLMTMLLFGCESKEEVPVLEEPIQNYATFRPLGRVTIGKPHVVMGNVVPVEYCHYYEKATAIKEFKCTVGDYVNKGDVLAVADLETLKEELDDQISQKALYMAKYNVQKPLYELNREIMELQRKELMDLHDYVGYEDMRVQIEVEDEKHKYDEELYEFMVESYDRRIADINEQIANGSLKAEVSGYVTFIKDTGKNNRADINEAVVIVADYDNTYIEVPKVTAVNDMYRKYEFKVAYVDGKQVPIEEYEYTQKELTYAKATESYPNARYKVPSNVKLNVGDTVPILFILKRAQDVLGVGLDSTDIDEEGQFVYVKTGDGTMEKRYFEAGVSDDYYVEVLSGLDEGDEIYYSQETSFPVSYSKYTVERQDYTELTEAKSLRKAEINNTAYTAPCTGVVKELKTTGDSVEKGDVLMVIDSHGGSAAIQDADKGINQLTVDYLANLSQKEREIYGYDYLLELEKKEDKRKLLLDQKKVASIEKEVLELEYNDSLERLKKAKAKLDKNNDGNGLISIPAQDEGTISKIFVKKGEQVGRNNEKTLLASCTKSAPDMAYLSMGKGASIVPIGAKIEIVNSATQAKYDAVCISNAWNGKCYSFTRDGKNCVSNVVVEDSKSGCITAKLEDETFFDSNAIKDCKVNVRTFYSKGMIVLPGSLVHYENSKTKDAKMYYVWKIVNDQLVKQYIITGSEYGIGNDTTVVVLMGLEEGDILAK